MDAPLSFEAAIKYAEDNKLYCYEMYNDGLITEDELVMMACDHYCENA